MFESPSNPSNQPLTKKTPPPEGIPRPPEEPSKPPPKVEDILAEAKDVTPPGGLSQEPIPPELPGEDLESKKSSLGRKIFLIILIASGVVILGTAGLYFYNKSQTTPLDNTNQANQNIFPNVNANANVNTNINLNANTNVNTNANLNQNVNQNINKNVNQGTVDSDNDGLTDAEEAIYGTDKNNPDTDKDGYLDGEEIENGYNPLGEGEL